MIELKDVSFSYGSAPFIKNVNLTIEQRDFLGIVGANGSGKSTLLKIIMGLLQPVSGKLIKRDKISMGYMPQSSCIDRSFPMTVREAVSLGLVDRSNLFSIFKEHRNNDVDEAMQRMGVMDIAQRSVGELSGGELQRTLLARAIVSHPDVLLLDEPLTYLDNRCEVELYELLQKLNSECAIVLVGHDVENIRRYAKRIAVVDKEVVIEKCCR